MFLRVGDVRTVERAADTLIGVSRVHHHHVRTLFQQLSHHAVDVERFSASRRAQAEEVRVVRHLHLSFLSRDVDGNRQALPVRVERRQRSLLRVLQVFLKEQAQGSIRQRQEQVIVLREAVCIPWERVLEQLQLVICRVGGGDAALVQFRLHVRGDCSQLVKGTAHQDVEV